MHKTKRAIEAIENAIIRITERIDNPNTPETGPESKKQLIYNMGRIIIDSWPYTNSLGEAILKAEQEYNKINYK